MTVVVLIGSLVFGLLGAQTRPKIDECQPDEVDIGDYCASLPPAVTETEKKKRRVTRFRGKSMMPGRVGAKPATVPAPPAKEPLTEPLVAPAEPTSGFIVQLGAFSSREVAESVAASLSSSPILVRIVPLDRGDHVLWACIKGPFENRELAVQSRDLLRKDKRFRSAYVKLLDTEIRQGLANDNTEK